MGISQGVELRHLRAFVAVAEALNFRLAAERLHLSQPPLSRTIAQFEGLVGRALFARSRQGVALTAAGSVLLPRARRVLEGLDDALAGLPGPPGAGARAAGADGAHTRGPRRIGVFFAVHPAAQAELLAALGAGDASATTPGEPGRARIEVGRSHELTAAVRQGRLDAALVMLPAPTQGLAVHEIGRAEMHAAVPAAHPLARRRSLAVAELDAFPKLLFLGRRQNAPLYAHLDDALRRRGLVAPRYSVPRDTYSGVAQIAAGEACTILCSWVGDFLQAGVALRPLRKADRLVVSIGWVTRAPDAASALAVAATMRARFAAPRPASRRRTVR